MKQTTTTSMLNKQMTRRSALALGATAALATTGLLSGCGGAASKPMMDASVTRAFTCGSYDTELFVVDLEVKNNSDTNLMSGVLSYSYATATHDGKALPSGFMMPEAEGYLSESTTIAPGETGPGQAVFELDSREGTVEFVLTVDTVDYKDKVEVLRQTFNLAEVERIESEATFYVSVDDVVVTDDGEGTSLLVLALTFTNNAESPASFGTAVKTELYQNDIALKSGYLPYNHPAANDELESNSYIDVKKGASLPVQIVYQLLDASTPVEMCLVDNMSYDQRVVMEKTIEIKGASGSPSAETTA